MKTIKIQKAGAGYTVTANGLTSLEVPKANAKRIARSIQKIEEAAGREARIEIE